MNLRQINYEVMTDTQKLYESLPELKDAIVQSVASQYMISHEDNIDQSIVPNFQTQYVVSGKRSLEAARSYAQEGKKVAVLNYANNHAIGGAPFTAGAQEESLCRCSTLYPCLQAMCEPFYNKHTRQYFSGEINHIGNDDLIFTPDVIVFKTDERTFPVVPQLLPKEDWYKVNMITCAAPELCRDHQLPDSYEDIITSRIKKILDVAAKEQMEVLILGAWGCGAFANPIEIVSKVFVNLLKNYNFQIVEFALATNSEISNTLFGKSFLNHINSSTK